VNTFCKYVLIITILLSGSDRKLFSQDANTRKLLEARFMNWGGVEGLSGWCHAIHQDDDGLIWIVNSDGLLLFDGLNFNKLADPPNDFEFFRTIFEINDTLYLGDYDKPLHFFPKKKSTFTIEKVNWGIEEELNIWSRGKAKLFADIKSTDYNGVKLSHYIRYIHEDSKDINKLWIPSKHGLIHLDLADMSHKLKRPKANEALTLDTEDSSFRIQDGAINGEDIWLSSYGNGLIQYNTTNNTWRTFRYEPPFTGQASDANVISSISNYGDGNLIIGARDLKVFNIADKQFYDFNRRHAGANATSIPAVHIIDGGMKDKYIITGGIISKLSAQHNKFKTGDIKLWEGVGSRFKIKQIIHCSDNVVVFELNNETYLEWNFLEDNHQMLKATEFEIDVNHNKIGPDGNTWKLEHNQIIVQKRNGEKIPQELITDALANIRISKLHFDKDKQLWFFSDVGLIEYDLITHNFKIYNENDGLTKNNWTEDVSGCNCDNGQFIFSTGSQFAMLEAKDSVEQGYNLLPYVNSVSVYEERIFTNYSMSNNHSINLLPSENYFTVNYSAYSKQPGKPTIIEHKLEGFDREWQSGSPPYSASYANISPGDYTFKVRAKYLGNDWNYNNDDLFINIEPSFTESNTFIALLSLLGMSLLYLFYRLRTNFLMKEERLKSSFKEELAKSKLEALRSQMNPHFLFNCLNSIDNYILNKQPHIASDYLSKFSKLMRKILDHSKMERINLEEELDTLKIYMEMEQMRFEDKFTYNINVSEDIDMHKIEIPPMLLQPYIENAIWHGLIHKEGAGCIDISIFRKNGGIVCNIEDDGIGREKSRQLKLNQDTTRKSHGMKIIKERLRLIKEIEGMGGEVVISDLNKPSTVLLLAII